MAWNKMREIIVSRILKGGARSTSPRSWASTSTQSSMLGGSTRSVAAWTMPPGLVSPSTMFVGPSRRTLLPELTVTPNVSIQGFTRQFEVAEVTMRRLVKVDLRLKSLVRVKTQQ